MSGIKMVSRMPGALAFICVCLAATSAKAQITPSGGGYLFRVKFAKGQKRDYTLVMSVNMAGMKAASMRSTGTIRIETLKVQGKTGLLRLTTGGMQMSGTAEGKSQESTLPGGTVEFRMNERGQMMDPRGKSWSNQQGFIFPLYPEKPLKVGATFSSRIEGGLPNAGVILTFKFIGIKTVEGRRVAQLNMTQTGASELGVRSMGILLLDTADGSVIQQKTDGTIERTENDNSIKAVAHVTIQRKN